MLTRRGFSGLLVGAAMAPAALRAQVSITSEIDRSLDAEALVRFAEETHPRGAEAKLNPEWRAIAAAFISKARALSYSNFVVEASRLLAWFKDGHSIIWAERLSEGPFGLRLPVRAAPFFDGLYVTEAGAAALPLLGARIIRVGSLDIHEAILRFAAIWPADNLAGVHQHLGLLLIPGFLHGLGAVAGADTAPVPVEALQKDGRTVRLALNVVAGESQARDKVKRKITAQEEWAAEAKNNNYVRRLPGQNTLYISLDNLGVDVPTFLGFTRQILSAMAEPQWNRIILDLRRNPGGNNFLAEPLRRELARSRFNRPGGLYVLTGPQTFSAAQNVVNRLERETFAIFVGEPASGAPRHYGDAKPFSGVVKGLEGQVSTIPWFDSYPQDHRKWVMPDLLKPKVFADWVSGRDIALETALNDTTNGPPDEMTTERVFYYGRDSQSVEWKPFWMG